MNRPSFITYKYVLLPSCLTTCRTACTCICHSIHDLTVHAQLFALNLHVNQKSIFVIITPFCNPYNREAVVTQRHRYLESMEWNTGMGGILE